MFRKAIVKGSFYPSNREEIENFIKKYSLDKKIEAKSVICPHAGYIYSGKTMVKTLTYTKINRKVIILSPNHTGLGQKVALYPKGKWETVFGDVKISEELFDKLNKDIISVDSLAHLQEHSIEVILPVLKYLNDDIEILPICVSGLTFDECEKVANDLYELLKNDDDFLIVVSSDMNHFESVKISEKKDKLAINRILNLDAKGLLQTVMDNKISMCGVFPSVINILLMKKMNVLNVKLIEYTHSGLVNNDNSSVVGYSGIVFY